MAISRDGFLAKKNRRYETIKLDGDEYRIQNLTEKERASFELSLQDKKGNLSFEKSRRSLLVRVLVDDNGNRLFADGEESLLEPLDGRITAAIYDAANRHCGYDRDEIETLVKNSGAATA